MKSSSTTNTNFTKPQLLTDEEGLALVWEDMRLRGDFRSMLPRVRPDKLPHEMLVRAARGKHLPAAPTAIDATAGLGEDALLLAAAGFTVQLYEYNPVIAALLRDALERAASIPELASISERMTLREENSLTAMRALAETGAAPPDLIFLDPMFPEKRNHAYSKKKLQLLQKIERPCSDEIALFQAARVLGPQKIVVKRPRKGPYLADAKPGYSIEGKTIRYDCYVFSRLG